MMKAVLASIFFLSLIATKANAETYFVGKELVCSSEEFKLNAFIRDRSNTILIMRSKRHDADFFKNKSIIAGDFSGAQTDSRIVTIKVKNRAGVSNSLLGHTLGLNFTHGTKYVSFDFYRHANQEKGTVQFTHLRVFQNSENHCVEDIRKSGSDQLKQANCGSNIRFLGSSYNSFWGSRVRCEIMQ